MGRTALSSDRTGVVSNRTATTLSRPGIFKAGGYSLKFDGSSTLVSLSNDTSINNIWDGGGTVELWIYSNNSGESDSGAFIVNTNWSLQFLSGQVFGSNIRFVRSFSDTAGSWRTSGPALFPHRKQHQLVITYNNDNTTNLPSFYIDGVAVAQTTIAAPVGTRGDDSSFSFAVGNNAAATSTLDGNIALMRWWKGRELTNNEILASYLIKKIPTTGVQPCLIWNFSDGADATITDSSGNSNNGTITNGTWSTFVPWSNRTLIT